MATREAFRWLVRGVNGAGLAGLRARGAFAAPPSGGSSALAALRPPAARSFGAAAAPSPSPSSLSQHGLPTKGPLSLPAIDAAAGLPGLWAREAGKPRFYRGGAHAQAHSEGHRWSRFADRPEGAGAGGQGCASVLGSGAGFAPMPPRYSSEAGKTDDGAKPPEKESKASMVTRYGVTFMLWWGTLYAVPLAAIYAALSTGAMGGADAIMLLKHVGLDKIGIDITTINPTFGNLALSYGINEALEIGR